MLRRAKERQWGRTMASEDFKDFLIGIGFLVDEAGARKAQETHAKVEAGITATATAEAGKREAIEEKAGDSRISFATAISRLLQIEEEKLSDSRDKARKADAAKDEAAAAAAVKKQKERREEAIKSAGKFALNVASLAAKAMTALEGMALGIFWAADKAAGGMEKLQYAAAWAGTTPKGMNAFSYAAQQLGENAAEAEADLSKFGNTLKTIPAMEGVLKNMGIQTRDAKGNWRDMTDLATEYMAKLKDMPKLQREARGGMLGLGENTMRVGIDPRFAGYERQYKSDQDAVGNDDDANGARGAAFERSSRRLKSTVGGVYNRVMGSAMADLQPQLDKLQQWMSQHGDQVAATLDRITKDIIALANAILEKLSQVNWDKVLTSVENFVKDFDKTATAAFGENGTLIAPFALFGAALLSKFVGPLNIALSTLRLLAAVPLPAWILAFAGVSGAMQWQGAKDTAKILGSDDPTKNDVVVDPESGMATKVGEGEGNQGTGPETGFNRKTGALAWFKGLFGIGGDDHRVKDAIISTAEGVKKLAEKADRAEMDGGAGGGEGGGGGGGGMFGKAAGYIGRVFNHFGGSSFHGLGNFGEKGWWTPERQSHAIDVLMKEAGLTEAGAKALVARWKFVESPGGPNAVNPRSGAEGIAQWLGKRKGDGSTGTFDEQLKKVARELNGAESRAKTLLNTPGKEATGASTFERAEGYNAATGQDNYTARTAEGMKHIVHGPQVAKSDAVPATPAPSPTPDTSKDTPLDTPGLVHLPEYEAADKILSSKTATKAQKAAAQKVMDRWNSQSFPSKVAGAGPGQPVGTSTDTTPVPGPSSYPTLLINPKTGRKDTSGAPEIDHSAPVKVEVTDASAAKIGKASLPPHSGNPLADLKRSIFDGEMARQEREKRAKLLAGIQRHAALDPRLGHPFGLTPGRMAAITHSHRRGDTVLNHSPTFNVAGGDTRTAMDHARLTATRGAADMLRNLQVMDS